MTRQARRSGYDIAASLILEVGREQFPAEMLSAYRELAGCSFCAAFALDAEAGPRVLFAEGVHPSIPDFAQEASRAYAERYWRQDRTVDADAARFSEGRGALLRLAAEDISSAEYKRQCYDRAGVVERLALYNPEIGPFLIAGYRAASRGHATPEERSRIAAAGPAMLAAMRRHNELANVALSDQRTKCYRAMIDKAKAWGLSEREAQVAAGLADGQGQTEIAERWDIAFSSVVTYRKRAYKKLKVENRKTLRALFDAQSASAGSAAAMQL